MFHPCFTKMFREEPNAYAKIMAKHTNCAELEANFYCFCCRKTTWKTTFWKTVRTSNTKDKYDTGRILQHTLTCWWSKSQIMTKCSICMYLSKTVWLYIFFASSLGFLGAGWLLRSLAEFGSDGQEQTSNCGGPFSESTDAVIQLYPLWFYMVVHSYAMLYKRHKFCFSRLLEL